MEGRGRSQKGRGQGRKPGIEWVSSCEHLGYSVLGCLELILTHALLFSHSGEWECFFISHSGIFCLLHLPRVLLQTMRAYGCEISGTETWPVG